MKKTAYLLIFIITMIFGTVCRAENMLLYVNEGEEIKQTTEDMLGLNYEWDSRSEVFLNDDLSINSEYASALSEYPMPMFRMAGSSSRIFMWKQTVGPMSQRSGQNNGYDKMETYKYGPVEWVKHAKAVNKDVKLTYVVNMEMDTAESAGDLAEFLCGTGDADGDGTDWAAKRREYGLAGTANIAIWELGNEVNAPTIYCGLPGLSKEEYVTKAKEYIAAIRKADPDAVFAACGHLDTVSTDTEKRAVAKEWNQYVLTALKDDVSYLTVHLYYSQYHMVAYENAYMDELRDLVNGISSNIKLYYSEYSTLINDLNSTDATERTHGMYGVLATSEFFNRVMVRPEVAAADYHCLYGPKNWSYIYFDAEGTMKPSAIAQLARMYKNYAVGTTVKSTLIGYKDSTTGENGVTSLAVKGADGSLNIIITNQTGGSVTIPVSPGKTYKMAEKSELYADMNSSRTDKDLNNNWYNASTGTEAHEIIDSQEYYLSGTAFAANTGASGGSFEVRPYSVTAVKLLEDTSGYTSTIALGDVYGCSAEYSNGVLKLSGKGTITGIDGVHYGAGIRCTSGNLKIELDDSADITIKGGSGTDGYAYGIYCDNASIEISGGGKLTVNSGEGTKESSAIATYGGSHNVTINGSEVHASGSTCGIQFYGGSENLGTLSIINGGSLYAHGGVRALSHGVTLADCDIGGYTADNNDSIQDIAFCSLRTYLYVAGTELTDSLTIGGVTASYDRTSKTLTLSGKGTIQDTGTFSNARYGSGIYTSMGGTLTIDLAEGADITVNSSDTAGEKYLYGIYTVDTKLNITGTGRLTVNVLNDIDMTSATNYFNDAICTNYSDGSSSSKTGITIDGAEVIANGRNNARSRGLNSMGGDIAIRNGARVTAKGGTRAIALTWGSVTGSLDLYSEPVITAASDYDGTAPVIYDAANINNYKYLDIRAVIHTGVYIAGTEIGSDGNMSRTIGGVTAVYDRETQTLSLSGSGNIENTVYDTVSYGAGIAAHCGGALNIVVESGSAVNVINRLTEGDYHYGIYTDNTSLSISGAGQLKADVSGAGKPAAAVATYANGSSPVGGVAVSGAALIADGGENGFAVYTYNKPLTLTDNARLSAHGKAKAVNAGSVEIYSGAAVKAAVQYDGGWIAKYSFGNMPYYRTFEVKPQTFSSNTENLGAFTGAYNEKDEGKSTAFLTTVTSVGTDTLSAIYWNVKTSDGTEKALIPRNQTEITGAGTVCISLVIDGLADGNAEAEAVLY